MSVNKRGWSRALLLLLLTVPWQWRLKSTVLVFEVRQIITSSRHDTSLSIHQLTSIPVTNPILSQSKWLSIQAALYYLKHESRAAHEPFILPTTTWFIWRKITNPSFIESIVVCIGGISWDLDGKCNTKKILLAMWWLFSKICQTNSWIWLS